MFKPHPTAVNAELRAGGNRILAVGRNDGFPKLAESHCLTRFHDLKIAGRATRLVRELEAVEVHPERYVTFPDDREVA